MIHGCPGSLGGTDLDDDILEARRMKTPATRDQDHGAGGDQPVAMHSDEPLERLARWVCAIDLVLHSGFVDEIVKVVTGVVFMFRSLSIKHLAGRFVLRSEFIWLLVG